TTARVVKLLKLSSYWADMPSPATCRRKVPFPGLRMGGTWLKPDRSARNTPSLLLASPAWRPARPLAPAARKPRDSTRLALAPTWPTMARPAPRRPPVTAFRTLKATQPPLDRNSVGKGKLAVTGGAHSGNT